MDLSQIRDARSKLVMDAEDALRKLVDDFEKASLAEVSEITVAVTGTVALSGSKRVKTPLTVNIRLQDI